MTDDGVGGLRLSPRALRKVALLAGCALFALCARALGYQAETVSNGATISGRVVYAGPPPTPRQIQITKDLSVCGAGPHYAQDLVVGPEGGVQYAVVSLKDAAKGAPLKPEKGVTFDQKGCEYVPRVLAFPVGSTVNIVNSDGILHTVHLDIGNGPPVDMAQPGFKRVMPFVAKQPGLFSVSCDAHNWMQGWWFVADNPYFAVTDENGRYTIRDVPPGTYTLKVWQEKLGTLGEKVTVVAGENATVNPTLMPSGAAGSR